MSANHSPENEVTISLHVIISCWVICFLTSKLFFSGKERKPSTTIIIDHQELSSFVKCRSRKIWPFRPTICKWETSCFFSRHSVVRWLTWRAVAFLILLIPRVVPRQVRVLIFKFNLSSHRSCQGNLLWSANRGCFPESETFKPEGKRKNELSKKKGNFFTQMLIDWWIRI